MSSAHNTTDPGLSTSEEYPSGLSNEAEPPLPDYLKREDPHWSNEEFPSDEEPPPETTRTAPEPQRHYPPRTCRICLEKIFPTYETPQEGISATFYPAPSVSYISSDPQAGRLIRPCKCKGSSRYVHEGCLQAWRYTDLSRHRRNYWECMTCGFRYQLERMRWSRWITSTLTQIFLTIVIMVIIIFLFGFAADPILDAVLGPLEDDLEVLWEEDTPLLLATFESPWIGHFVKGMASVGLLGFVRVLIFSPFPLWNIRGLGGLRGGRRGGTGRDRLQGIHMTLIITGLFTLMIVGR